MSCLKKTDVALFGAITSKPRDEAAEELAPELRDKGYVYFSPIVRLRQMFNLHTNMRPCKAYTGNPLNLKDGIDIVIFRENTEGLYSGVEFHPVPQEVFDSLKKAHPKMSKFEKVSLDDMAISTRIMTRKACESIVTQGFEFAKKFGRKSVTVVDKPNVLRETGGLMLRTAREVAKRYPGIELWETNIDAQCMWLVKNPQDYDVWSPRTCSETFSPTSPPSSWAASASPARAISVTTTPSSSPRTARHRSTSARTRSIPSP